jgi:hypothetical protein
MEIKLTFKITYVSGEQSLQEIAIPADARLPVENQQKALMQTMMTQYASVGIIRQPTPNSYRLILPSQLAMVECELPSIILADAIDVPKVTLD